MVLSLFLRLPPSPPSMSGSRDAMRKMIVSDYKNDVLDEIAEEGRTMVN